MAFYEEVEEGADYYAPSVYSLLTFYHSLQAGVDPMSGRFVPMTTVLARESKDVKIFAVGLLPPAAIPTGRKLDRGESIRDQLSEQDGFINAEEDGQIQQSSPEAPKQLEEAKVEEAPDNVLMCQNPPPMTQVSSGPDQSMQQPTAALASKHAACLGSLHPSIQPLAVKLIQLAARQGVNIVLVEGERTIEYQDSLYAQGRTTPGPVVSGVKGGESWHNFGLAFDIAMVSPGPKPKPGTASWPKGRDVWQQLGNLGKSLGMQWGGDFPKLADYGHFEYHPGLTKADARAGKRPAVAGEVKPVESTAPPATKWADVGSSNAAESSKAADERAARRKQRVSELQQQYLARQQQMIDDTLAAIKQIAQTPPLRLLVNPQSFRVSSEQVIADGSMGRSGPIIEHWGHGQDKIEGSGKIAAFYAMNEVGAPGLSRTTRQFSHSYQNLLSLWLLYRNNGGVYLPDYLSRDGKTKSLSVVGAVYLYYDEILYVGSFDSFSINEVAENPYSLEYSFSFTVASWYLLDQNTDAGTYGAAAALRGS